jgi:hypothetical protein
MTGTSTPPGAELSSFIRNDDGTCRVEGCSEYASELRSTRTAMFFIAYCPRHEEEAARLFELVGGDEDR